jgi:hypothetical protein
MTPSECSNKTGNPSVVFSTWVSPCIDEMLDNLPVATITSKPERRCSFLVSNINLCTIFQQKFNKFIMA